MHELRSSYSSHKHRKQLAFSYYEFKIKLIRQECMPVGFETSAPMAVSGGGDVCRGCLPMGGCLLRVGMCLPAGGGVFASVCVCVCVRQGGLKYEWMFT